LYLLSIEPGADCARRVLGGVLANKNMGACVRSVRATMSRLARGEADGATSQGTLVEPDMSGRSSSGEKLSSMMMARYSRSNLSRPANVHLGKRAASEHATTVATERFA